jgi:hypothetical protein
VAFNLARRSFLAQVVAITLVEAMVIAPFSIRGPTPRLWRGVFVLAHVL